MAFCKTLLVLATLLVAASAQADPTSSTPLPLGPNAQAVMVGAAASYPALSAPVTGARLTQYANPAWDGHLAGKKAFWMGLADGGCGYGNLLSDSMYPHLSGISLTTPLRKALGIEAGVGCGACVRVTCPEGVAYCKPGNPSVVAVVLDICPDGVCTTMQADLYTSSFALLAEGSNPEGVVIERVQCPAPGNVQLHVIELSNTYMKVNLQSVGGSGVVAKVEVSFDGATFAAMKNDYGAAWIFNGLTFKGTPVFRVTLDDGDVRTSEPLAGLKQGKWNEAVGGAWADVRDLGFQFGSAGGLGGAAAKPAAVKTTAAPAGGLGGAAPVAAAGEVAPDPAYTCAQQKAWGKCGSSFMTAAGNPRVCPAQGCCHVTCAAAVASGRKLLGVSA